MTAPLYILTDSTGYTTACPAVFDELLRESARRPLIAPITVHHWARVSGVNTARQGWKLMCVKSWPKEDLRG